MPSLVVSASTRTIVNVWKEKEKFLRSAFARNVVVGGFVCSEAGATKNFWAKIFGSRYPCGPGVLIREKNVQKSDKEFWKLIAVFG